MYKFVHPKEFLSYNRLDILLKYLYIDEYLRGNATHYHDLYIRHIELRTSFQEDDKNCAKDFIHSFNLLIESIKNDGFKQDVPIEISSTNGINLNGAHRIACALYFDLEVPIVHKSIDGFTWCKDWFIENKFENSLLDELILLYVKLSANTTSYLIWNSLEGSFDKVEAVLRLNEDIIYSRDIELNTRESIIEFVNDIYACEHGPSIQEVINNKGISLSSYEGRKMRLIITDGSNFDKTIKLKNKIRKQFESIVRSDLYMSIHSSDDPAHSYYLSSLFLSNLNVARLNSRKNVSKELKKWMDEFYSVLVDKNIAIEDVCIVGSSSMDVFGIRTSTDLDFILSSKVRDGLYNDDVNVLTNSIDLVSKGYLRLADKDVTDDIVINNPQYHFIYKGFKFIDVLLVKKRKEIQCREKDVRDVELINSWLLDNDLNNQGNDLMSKVKFQIWYVFIAKPKVMYGRIVSYLKSNLSNRNVDRLKKIKNLMK